MWEWAMDALRGLCCLYGHILKLHSSILAADRFWSCACTPYPPQCHICDRLVYWLSSFPGYQYLSGQNETCHLGLNMAVCETKLSKGFLSPSPWISKKMQPLNLRWNQLPLSFALTINFEKKKFGQFLWWLASSYVFRQHILLWLDLVSLWTNFEVVPTRHPKHSHRKHHPPQKGDVMPSAWELEPPATLLQPPVSLQHQTAQRHNEFVPKSHSLIHCTGRMLLMQRKAVQCFVFTSLFIAWSQALFTSNHSNTILVAEFVISSSFLLG